MTSGFLDIVLILIDINNLGTVTGAFHFGSPTMDDFAAGIEVSDLYVYVAGHSTEQEFTYGSYDIIISKMNKEK